MTGEFTNENDSRNHQHWELIIEVEFLGLTSVSGSNTKNLL